jgi:GTP cyclohydrolase I
MSAETIVLKAKPPARPDRREAEDAVRTLLSYFGEDPGREGLLDTPRRFIEVWSEFLSGYAQDPVAILSRTFEEVAGYSDLVLLKDMRFESHCEHHLQPIVGVAHVAYLPSTRVVGISKLARVVDAHARRLVSQEAMTQQIADAIDSALAPRGVAVLLEAEHHCISTRGVRKRGVSCITQALTGAFRDDPAMAPRLFRLIERPQPLTSGKN